jgi:two-component system LytT family sensor kinase
MKLRLVYNKLLFKHLLFWLGFIIYICLVDPLEGSFFVQFVGTFLIVFNFAFTYYFETLFILPYFYNRKWILFYFAILAFLIYYGISYFIFFCFLNAKGVYTSFTDWPFYRFIINESILFSIISTISLGSYQNKIGIERIKLKGEKKRALLLKELGFLKNQFNSHITFNFLNFCYNQIHKSSNETAESIEIFSRMLRYSLNNKVGEKVNLENEIEHIEDFIKLQQLLNADIKVNFIKSNYYSYPTLILPGILIALVENAFKHGNLNSNENPIRIEVAISLEFLNFKVSNEKNKHKINEPSGIGQHNLKQQLELLYKNKYTLKIEDKDNIYSSELTLILN